MSYSHEQASDVLEACGRASHEAILAVEFVHGVFLRRWDDLSDEERDKSRRDAALALDILIKADELGADVEAADRAIDEFAKLASMTGVRSNLVISVVAAVKATIDAEADEQ